MASYKLFTANVSKVFDKDLCADLPGFSHIVRDTNTIYFFAKSRSDAANQIGRFMGINWPCDLSSGHSSKSLLSAGIVRALDTYHGKAVAA